jgi:alpha-beta hydrolase superfamily lysophospholipase
MNQLRTSLILTVLITFTLTSATRAQQAQPTLQTVDLKSADGVLLKATYFPAGQPGPGILLFHQSNRTRASWNDVARQLAAAGINTLALDTRGYGESGGTRKEATQPEKQQADLETAFRFLLAQPGVQPDVIGSAGTGWLGVDNSVQSPVSIPRT